MSRDVLRETMRQALEQGGRQISFGWQGGEPTLMGLNFFKEAVEFQQRFGRGQEAANGLQTNGLLLDPEWARFLAEYKFLVGLSLDGPAHVHDRYRRTAAGKGSQALVEERARMLLSEGAEVNALVVVNDYSAHYPDEIYGYLKSLEINYMQFIPCVELDPSRRGRAASFSVNPDKFGEFMRKLFDLWWDDFQGLRPTTSIRLFESLFHLYVEVPPPLCTLLEECGTYLVVEHTGDVYSCDFFVDEEHHLGHVLNDRLIDLLQSDRQQTFGEDKAQLHAECRDCSWLGICRGGCPKDRLNNPTGNGLSALCPSYKLLFPYIDERMRDLARRWNVRQSLQGEAPGRNDPCPCGSGKKFKQCCGA